MTAENGKRGPGNPNWTRGGPSPHPGGQSKEQKAARDLLNAKLDSDEMRDAFVAGYMDQLKKGNALILVDYANRKLGKPVESVSIDANINGGENPAKPLTTEQLIAIARAEKERA